MSYQILLFLFYRRIVDRFDCFPPLSLQGLSFVQKVNLLELYMELVRIHVNATHIT